MRVWHLLTAGAALAVAAVAAATTASRLFVLEAFVAAMFVFACGFQFALRLGRSTLRPSQVLTCAAALLAALTAAAVSGSRWSAIEAFAVTSFVLGGGAQVGFRFGGAQRARTLAAAGRGVKRAARVATFAFAGLLFALVAVAATLIESGIYTWPRH